MAQLGATCRQWACCHDKDRQPSLQQRAWAASPASQATCVRCRFACADAGCRHSLLLLPYPAAQAHAAMPSPAPPAGAPRAGPDPRPQLRGSHHDSGVHAVQGAEAWGLTAARAGLNCAAPREPAAQTAGQLFLHDICWSRRPMPPPLFFFEVHGALHMCQRVLCLCRRCKTDT